MGRATRAPNADGRTQADGSAACAEPLLGLFLPQHRHLGRLAMPIVAQPVLSALRAVGILAALDRGRHPASVFGDEGMIAFEVLAVGFTAETHTRDKHENIHRVILPAGSRPSRSCRRPSKGKDYTIPARTEGYPGIAPTAGARHDRAAQGSTVPPANSGTIVVTFAMKSSRDRAACAP